MYLYVDASALAHAIAHGMKPEEVRMGSAGVAVGLASQVTNFIRAHQATRTYWCLDSKEGSWRKSICPTYKGQREKQYEDDPERKMRRDVADRAVKEDLPQLVELLECPVFWMPHVEADDCAAAVVGLNPGKPGIILTTDKDYWQLLSPSVQVLNPVHQYRLTLSQQGTILQTKADGTQEDYGITPEQWVLVKALQGDKSDNLQGLIGCGEETALKVVRERRVDTYLTEQTGMVTPRKSKTNPAPIPIQQDARAVAAHNASLMSLTSNRVYDKVRTVMETIERGAIRDVRTNYTKLLMWLDARGYKNPETAQHLASAFSRQWTC